MPASSKTAPAIEVESLRKTYREGIFRPRRVDALRGVSLTVERGSIFGILGPNGAGKTTLIKVLLGIVRKSGGTATLLGFEAGDRRGRASVGYLPENHRIPRHHTANTALEYYGALSGMSVRTVRQRRPEMLKLVGLEKWGKTPVREFSKGMQQRLGLAQAMIHDPELLVLDEPTDGVDPVGRSEMRETMRRLKDAGKTVFINSHLLQEIELVCDRVAILVKGEVRREGLVEAITQRRDAELELTLRGSEQAIRRALDGWNIGTGLAAAGGGQFQVVLKIGDQSEVDRCVDGLRKAGVSLVELARRRDTLEEAFLDIVKQPVVDSPFLE
ncbi:MAG TPA: ABC transporter ATP-binding protein [Planctomycetaceae bacterium]|jgi:ABC-2 type transport system ATP-binding protein